MFQQLSPVVYLGAEHCRRAPWPFLAVHRQESCNPTLLQWLQVGWAGSVPAEAELRDAHRNYS